MAKNDNCIGTTSLILDFLKIKHTKHFLKESILSHPNHPSLLCIADTLELYRIDKIAIKTNYNKLKELPLPCIVEMPNDNGSFAVLTRISEHEAILSDRKRNSVLKKNKFLEKWTGVCLLVESNRNSKEPGIKKKMKEKLESRIFNNSFFILVFLTLFLLLKSHNTELQSILLLGYVLLKMVGLVIGVFLIWLHIESHDHSLRKFCSKGKLFNCDAVLGSKFAYIFNGRVSLSFIGFTYFFSTLFYLTLNSFSEASLSLVSLASILTVPVIFMSFYYQAFRIKQFCKFCIILLGVLILEIAIVVHKQYYLPTIDWESLPLFFTLALAPFFGWKKLKLIILARKENVFLKRNLNKIKRNPAVWNSLIDGTQKIKESTEKLGIYLNNNGKYEVVMVCDPYCRPCGKAFVVFDQLVEAGLINLQIIFTTSNSPKDIRLKVVKHFLAINKNFSNLTRKSMKTWHIMKEKDYAIFEEKYPLKISANEYDDAIEGMINWCKIQNISHTPTVFIDGSELPLEYSVDDLDKILI